jgi:hypothetical protein
MAVVKYQLRRLSRGMPPAPDVPPLKALLIGQFRTARLTHQYRRWISRRPLPTAPTAWQRPLR